MNVPRSLLELVEAHSCFAGRYDHRADVRACPPAAGSPAEELAVLSCDECLSFQVGVPRSALPAGGGGRELARAVSEHLRRLRGYELAVAGYHTAGPGFWLSAAYLAWGAFLLDGSRSRGLGSDLDLLVLAVKHGVIPAFDPRLGDAHHYLTQPLYLAPDAPLGAAGSLQELLASRACDVARRPGWRRVTLAQFLPVVAGDEPPAPAVREGDSCPRCRAEVRERPLLVGSFVGCLC